MCTLRHNQPDTLQDKAPANEIQQKMHPRTGSSERYLVLPGPWLPYQQGRSRSRACHTTVPITSDIQCQMIRMLHPVRASQLTMHMCGKPTDMIGCYNRDTLHLTQHVRQTVHHTAGHSLLGVADPISNHAVGAMCTPVLNTR